jgi:hypothetical protein
MVFTKQGGFVTTLIGSFSPDNTPPSFGGNSQAIGTPTDHNNNLTSVSAFWDGQDVTPPFYPINHYNASPVNYDNAFNNFDGSNYEANYDYTHRSGGGDAAPNQHYFGMGIVCAPTNPNHASVDESTTPAEATTKKRHNKRHYVGWKGENMENKLQEYLDHYNKSGGKICPKEFALQNKLPYTSFLRRWKELCPNWSPNWESTTKKRFATLLEKKEKSTDLKWTCGHCGVGTRNFPIENFDEDGLPVLVTQGNRKGCPNPLLQRKCTNPNCSIGFADRNWIPCGWEVVLGWEIVIVGEDEEEDNQGVDELEPAPLPAPKNPTPKQHMKFLTPREAVEAFAQRGIYVDPKTGSLRCSCNHKPIHNRDLHGYTQHFTSKCHKKYEETGMNDDEVKRLVDAKEMYFKMFPQVSETNILHKRKRAFLTGEKNLTIEEVRNQGLSPHDLDGEIVPAAKEGKNEKEVMNLPVEPGTFTEL